MNRPLGFLLSFLILATVVGCQRGDGQTYANVKGKVTFNGTPIEKGQISFALEGRPPSTVDIVDGKFAGQAMVGSNKVSVFAKRKSATASLPKSADTQVKGYQAKFKTNPGEFGGTPVAYDPTMVDYIPPEWVAQSKQMRVVESGGANDFEFAIKGK